MEKLAVFLFLAICILGAVAMIFGNAVGQILVSALP